MKISGSNRKRFVAMGLIAAGLFFFFTGLATGASGEEGHGAESTGQAVESTGHEAESGHAAESKGWLPTDTYKVMNFVVLAVGLFYLLRKPVSQALNGRIEGIREQLGNLETQKEAAEKTLAEYQKRLANLEQEAEQVIQDYIRQGNEAKSRIIQEAKVAAEKLQDQAQRNIEYEFRQASQSLKNEIVEKALVKAEEIIKKEISAKDQEKLVDEYLEKVA